MLGRNANGIFWMFRYLERAENTARLLDAGFRMALVRDVNTAEEEWGSVLTTLGMDEQYSETNDSFEGTRVCNYVLRDKDNPFSVLRMMELARFNARMARASITAEVWEAVNESWMILRDMLARPVRDANLGTVLTAVRQQSTLVRGATYGTMLRNEIFHFARCGTFLERADNTARFLDVKYYLLLPSLAHVGSSLDTSQWESVLRSLGGHRSYRWLNGGRMEARGIAQFLILDDRFPRSMAFSYQQLGENLAALGREHGTAGHAQEKMNQVANKLARLDIEAIFEMGLHEFLTEFILDNQEVADAISEDYRFTV